MNLLGYEISIRRKAAVGPNTFPSGFTTTSPQRGWFPLVHEPFPGAWQRNMEIRAESALSFAAVYACVTLIASDIGKLRLKLVQQDSNRIWNETDSPAFSPVLRKPNHYQIRIKFIEQWLTSKLIHGNAYVLKARDERNVVVGLYVLDPQRVRVLVTPHGDVYYALQQDDLSRVSPDLMEPEFRSLVVPASEIIHDVMVALYHPLCGVSPISACGLAAMQGLRMQQHSSEFFGAGAKPGGVLTAPGTISEEVAKRLEDHWNTNYGGANVGKIAVLGDGLTYEQMTMTSVDAQLIEQLKWTAENVCTAFHVPPYMIGVASPPAYNNIEALNQQYYSQCLQSLIESIELLMDEGLGLDKHVPKMGTEFDLDDLLRMDTPSRVKAAADAIGSGGMAPNEARARFFDLGPTDGGEGPYLQQQNYSLSALAKRDAQSDPFGTATPARALEPSAGLDKRFEVACRREIPMGLVA